MKITEEQAKEFGRLLTMARIRKGMTPEQLAERVGVSVDAVHRWEAGIMILRGENTSENSTES
jgi:transcriptional regulator with XRE-family HTH domain